MDYRDLERQKKIFSNLFLDAISGAAAVAAFVYLVSALNTLHWDKSSLTS